jgi:putative chitinase
MNDTINSLAEQLSKGAMSLLSDKLLVSLEQLGTIAPNSNEDRLRLLVPYLNQAMIHYGIDTPLRICYFLAQTAEESDGYATNREYASGDEYEGRTNLGNTEQGDGRRFKGRGLIELTGRENYYNCGQALGVDLIANPERLEDYDLACYSAGWYWFTHSLNNYADVDDLTSITEIINGGLNGYDTRLEYLSRAKQVYGI